MARSWWIAILACAACGGEGGSGFTLERIAALPMHSALGFDADGAPLLGAGPRPEPILRFDGAGWSVHGWQRLFSATSIDTDADGTPLVVHKAGEGPALTEVWRLEPDGTTVRLGDVVPDGGFEVMASATGARHLFTTTATWTLRPGAAAWQQAPLALRHETRGEDGRVYASPVSSLEVVRLEDDGSATTTRCRGGRLFGVDPAGRIYLRRSFGFAVCDPDTGVLEEVETPNGESLHSVRISDRAAILAEVGMAGLALFAAPLGAADFAPVRVGRGVPVPLKSLLLQLAPTGTFYVEGDDWLGRVVEQAP